ncbi:hypothetical protein VTH06DRAFT_4169 [Thermothelomyces fergusii]
MVLNSAFAAVTAVLSGMALAASNGAMLRAHPQERDILAEADLTTVTWTETATVTVTIADNAPCETASDTESTESTATTMATSEILITFTDTSTSAFTVTSTDSSDPGNSSTGVSSFPTPTTHYTITEGTSAETSATAAPTEVNGAGGNKAPAVGGIIVGGAMALVMAVA